MKLLLTCILIIGFLFMAFCRQSQDAKLAKQYFQKGELEKAEELFELAIQNQQDIPLLFSDYLKLLKQLNQLEKIEPFIKKTISLFPSSFQYQIELVKH
ncbi:MAG: hypothetical protein AAF789_04270 [Bacteroidota bacterium]